MKFGVPWNVKGVRPEVRNSAREAARRSGMSVGEWLNHVIAEQAADADDHHDEDDDFERNAERERLTERIDRLDQRLGQILARESAPAPAREIIYHADPRAYGQPYPAPAYAPHPAAPYSPQQPAPQPGQWTSSIDQAVAEISARQHSLDAPLVPQTYNPPPAAPAYYPPAASAPYVPGPSAPLPPVLQQPMQQQPAYAPPPVPRFPAQDLSGLENQLRHITGQIEQLHQPKDNEEISALRRELAEISGKLNEAMPKRAIEALEQETRKIAERIDDGRKHGVDPATISNMERGLADVHQALRELRPAESLSGFEDAIRNLSVKIDHMGAASHDPAFLQQLEAAITALRGIVSHIASNDSLGALADEIRGLSAKIERVAGSAGVTGSSEGMVALEQKIGALTEQLKMTNSRSGLERSELSSGEQFALGNLEDRIVSLAAKLDASDARLNQLGAIERGMAELLVHIEDLRAGGLNAAPRSDIKREITKTQDSLEAVHGTVGAVVDRLAVLESERHEPAVMPPPAPAAQRLQPRAVAPAVTVTPGKNPPTSARPMRAGPPPVRPRTPIDPTLPPDYPLEPGSGGPREGVSAAERIAASEAALGGISTGGTASSGSTNFIAAARRAAQAATPAEAAVSRPEPAKPEKPAGQKTLGQKVRSMLAGASVILLVAGGLKLSMNMLEPERTAELPVATSSQLADADDDVPASAPSRSAQAPETAIAVPNPNSIPQAKPLASPAEQDAQSDVTSSIGQSTALAPANEPLFPATTDQRLVPPEKLPVALRNAAINGDPAAAYEIAMRHLEGRGISQSLDEAARWLERGAKAGLAPAQFRLGSLYEKGQGVKKNLDTAQRLYQAAAQKGNAKAMHNLAVLHAEGAKGKPDYKTAALWFRKAADRGVADSQYNLGILYARGIGVEQNLPEAYKWFSLASSQGDKEATRKRDDVGARLDAQSLQAARLAAQTFAVEPQPDGANVVKTPEGGWDRASAAPKPAKKPRAIEPLRITPS